LSVVEKQEIRGGKYSTKTAATLKKVLKFSVRTLFLFERDLVLKAANAACASTFGSKCEACAIFSSVPNPSDCFKSSISLLESSPFSHFIISFRFHFQLYIYKTSTRFTLL
jgi:hypothetical protein